MAMTDERRLIYEGEWAPFRIDSPRYASRYVVVVAAGRNTMVSATDYEPWLGLRWKNLQLKLSAEDATIVPLAKMSKTAFIATDKDQEGEEQWPTKMKGVMALPDQTTLLPTPDSKSGTTAPASSAGGAGTPASSASSTPSPERSGRSTTKTLPSGSPTEPSTRNGDAVLPPSTPPLTVAKTRALARLYRLMEGLHKKSCPVDPKAHELCYWCQRNLYYHKQYVGDLRGQHKQGCPWNEVIDFRGYQEYMDGLDAKDATDRADP